MRAGHAPTRAAQYVRMSTEHQTYSIENQAAANAAYAALHDYEIVRTYADEAVSGVRMDGRDALKRLLADVLGGCADFGIILTYDVSRWGRFQDPDQAAHYEFICREAGVAIEYCAEPFANDGSLTGHLVKDLKRAMAAEYSRELSTKVASAQRGLAADGFWQSGSPGYGLRRQVISAEGAPLAILEAGESKAIQGQRCVLVHGPPHEVDTVRRIYRLLITRRLSTPQIARLLNAEGVEAAPGRRWSPHRVRQVLSSEKYAGELVYGRTRQRFRRHERRPSQDWVRSPGAVAPIVSPETFRRAALQLQRFKAKVGRAQLLAELRATLARRGRLTLSIIDRERGTHAASTCVRVFGGLMQAYAAVGFTPSARQRAAAAVAQGHRPWLAPRKRPTPSDAQLLAGLCALLAREGRLSQQLIEDEQALPGCRYLRTRLGSLAEIYRRVGYAPAGPPRRRPWPAWRPASSTGPAAPRA